MREFFRLHPPKKMQDYGVNFRGPSDRAMGVMASNGEIPRFYA